MSEQEQDRFKHETDDERADVEGHRRESQMSEEPTASDEESSEDFEAHKKR